MIKEVILIINKNSKTEEDQINFSFNSKKTAKYKPTLNKNLTGKVF